MIQYLVLVLAFILANYDNFFNCSGYVYIKWFFLIVSLSNLLDFVSTEILLLAVDGLDVYASAYYFSANAP